MNDMGGLTDVERDNVLALRDAGKDYALLTPTETGLRKSILDATTEYRDFLVRNRFHDFAAQLKGPENTVLIPVRLIGTDGEHLVQATLYRSKTRGDPRIWITGIGHFCDGGETLAFFAEEGQLVAMNASRLSSSAIWHKSPGNYGGNMEDIGYWGVLQELWKRSTGGSDVAARPSDLVDSVWPTAPRAAGVDQASEWFRRGLATGGLPRMLFLIGGPGAGKSHAAAEIVRGWRETSIHDDELAYRAYEYAVGAERRNRLLVINDATIRDDGTHAGSLIQDASDAARDGDYLLACVNRGILVEEFNAESRKAVSDEGAGPCLLKWMHSVPSGQGLWTIETHKEEDYLKAATLTEGGKPRAEVMAVFLDTCSMMERSPRVEIEPSDTSRALIHTEKYRVQDYTERSTKPTETPASVLFSKVISKVAAQDKPADQGVHADPINANVKSLRQPELRANLLSILRGAEIAAGQRMTFRELWGAVTRTLVGDLPHLIAANQLAVYLQEGQPRQGDSPATQFGALRKLAEHRYSQSIFGSESMHENPVTRLTRLVDPTRDAKPGRFDGSWESGWATPVTDAFASSMTEQSPLSALREDNSLPGRERFHEIVTDFEEALDAGFAKLMTDPNTGDAQRTEAISWYGDYLMRLYAVSNGIPAFHAEIALWTQTWDLSPALPDQLREPLETLLRPSRLPDKPSAASFIPIYDSRTNPIRGAQSRPKLALKLGAIDMETHSASESITLHLSEQSHRVASIALDFPLIREALACNDGHEGVTELTDVTSPRLERFRAARLVPAQLKRAHYTVVTANDESVLSVRDV